MIEGIIGKATMDSEHGRSEAGKNRALVVLSTAILMDCKSEVWVVLEKCQFKILYLFKAGILERGI